MIETGQKKREVELIRMIVKRKENKTKIPPKEENCKHSRKTAVLITRATDKYVISYNQLMFIA